MTPVRPRPNILWILTTQWRAQACGYAGDPNARTPALDRLAAGALRFDQAVTPHPFGPFARAALLTGKFSPENGVVNYFDPLPETARTIAHSLNEYGYRTAFFGKWHLAPRDPAAPLVGEAHARTRVPPARRGGFQFWEGFESGFLLNDPWLHGTDLPEPTRFPGYQSDVLVDRVSTYLTRATEAPWFCMLSLESPHPPYGAPAAGVRVLNPISLRLPPNVPPAAEAKAREELAGYYAHIEATDRALGRLFERIDFSTTAVVFTSVHGDMHGAHGLFRKGWPHEESVRVPLLVRVPGVPGRNCGEPVSLVDLANCTRAWAETGTWPVSADETAWISMPSVVELPYQCDRTWTGLRSPKRKIVLQADGAPWFFFDLEDDPGEQVNLIGDPRRAEEIETWIRKTREAARATLSVERGERI